MAPSARLLVAVAALLLAMVACASAQTTPRDGACGLLPWQACMTPCRQMRQRPPRGARTRRARCRGPTLQPPKFRC